VITRRDIVLLVLVVALAAVPLLVAHPAGAAFAGADAQATALVGRIAPGYHPWFQPLFRPGTEIASLLFAVQAGLGCGFLGYYLGLRVGRKRAEEDAG
jgi:cobalt/nickel transport protein